MIVCGQHACNCFLLLLSCFSHASAAPERHPRVAEVLLKHDALVCSSVQLIRDHGVYGLLDVFLPACPPKESHAHFKARENTIVDAH